MASKGWIWPRDIASRAMSCSDLNSLRPAAFILAERPPPVEKPFSLCDPAAPPDGA